MQIVINIDDKVYGLLKYFEEGLGLNDKKDGNDDVKTALMRAVTNGTPLPKGHGRIIDYGYVVDAIDDWINAEEYNYTNATDYLRNRIRNVPTIIEADTETDGAKMSEIPDCSDLDSCENCEYDDGECCRLLYEAKRTQESEVSDADSD